MRHWGGSGRYVEGERVFAPPAGSFDPDWVAAIVLERSGPAAGERVALAAAAQRAWDGRCAGQEPAQVLAALAGQGLGAATAAAVLRAAEDFARAYGVDGA
ncbi:hypothetical protein GTQ99_12585 [Kineococcus sp. T13]|uniref:hypothetical protein n=1 Tax=Kineococcus vitellinus TaxID=2696565 RepID=UPI001412D293|nr:hypothetical protein [Kineococcus vitellinus]NAZ76243.1 hypothetical protein [Kineococcus vitellinus]